MWHQFPEVNANKKAIKLISTYADCEKGKTVLTCLA